MKKSMATQLSGNDEVLGLFRNDARICAVYLHGSYAKGDNRPDSDVDFGILPVAGVHFTDYERAMMASGLSMILAKTIDVGEVSSRNLVYAKEVLYKGIPVYIRDDTYTQMMTMHLLSMYASFNEDRKELIDAWTN